MLYIYLILGLIVLLFGGKYLVDGSTSLALKLGMSPGLVGLTIVAFGTSAPELLVSISAALKGSSDISIGNVIGSNISNISLILGISALVYPIMIHRAVMKLDYVMMVLSSALFFLMAFDGGISRLEGGILVALLVAVNTYFFKKLSVDTKEDDVSEPKQSIWRDISLVLVGIGGLYFGAELLVNNAVEISRTYGVSERIIGVTIIAIGTSLPELVTSIVAALEKKTDLAIGNILGSNIFNVLCIVGFTGIVRPIVVSEEFINKDFLWMLGFTLLLFPLFLSRMRISRWEGALLLVSYGVYVYFLL